MLVRMGSPGGEQDAVDLLLACHERIRRFAAMAVRLAAATGSADAEVRDAAAAIRRYFAEALPLHVADEEEDLAPLLAGRSQEVDAALAAMAAEHVEHGPDLTRLVALCAELERAPGRHGDLREELGAVATRLSAMFEAHLIEEEAVLVPALRGLPQADRDALHRRIRARRAPGR